MKKQIFGLIFAGLLACTPLSAAVTATTVWEFRDDAGDLQNGSCFDPSVAVPGTDYSQQASSQYNGTDLVIDGADNTIVTSATHNFVAADEGNCIRVSAGTGFTVGWYVITDTNANAATLSSAVGTVGSTGGTYRVGGAALLNSTNADDYFEAFVAGNTGWVRGGSHSAGESISVANAGTTTSTMKIIGYNATRGDVPTGASRPTISYGANLFILGAYFDMSNVIITGTQASGYNTGAGSAVRNVKAANTSTGNGIVAGSGTKIINSEITSSGGVALSFTSAIGVRVHGSYIHDSVNCVTSSTGDYATFTFNVLDNCSTAGFDFGSTSTDHSLLFNTIYGAATPAGTGIKGNTTQGTNWVIFGNIISGWTTGIELAAASDSVFANYNNFYNNTTNRTNISAGANDLALDPGFADGPGGDFRVGVNMKAACLPSTFPGSATTAYTDCGAVQRIEGGGVPVVGGPVGY